MRREGEPRSENSEIEDKAEKTPERFLDKALMVKEKEAEQDPTTPSWIKRHKKGLKITGGVVAGIGGVAAGVMAFPKTALGIYAALHIYPYFMFIKKFIEKRGKMTFMDGYNTAMGMFGEEKGKK